MRGDAGKRARPGTPFVADVGGGSDAPVDPQAAGSGDDGASSSGVATATTAYLQGIGSGSARPCLRVAGGDGRPDRLLGDANMDTIPDYCDADMQHFDEAGFDDVAMHADVPDDDHAGAGEGGPDAAIAGPAAVRLQVAYDGVQLTIGDAGREADAHMSGEESDAPSDDMPNWAEPALVADLFAVMHVAEDDAQGAAPADDGVQAAAMLALGGDAVQPAAPPDDEPPAAENAAAAAPAAPLPDVAAGAADVQDAAAAGDAAELDRLRRITGATSRSWPASVAHRLARFSAVMSPRRVARDIACRAVLLLAIATLASSDRLACRAALGRRRAAALTCTAVRACKLYGSCATWSVRAGRHARLCRALPRVCRCPERRNARRASCRRSWFVGRRHTLHLGPRALHASPSLAPARAGG